MCDISDLFWNATVEELKRGYHFAENKDEFICLICGQAYVKGIIYPAQGVYYEAEKFVQLHIEQEHDSMFSYLLGLDKKWTGLTDHQKKLLHYFYQGLSDSEIVKELQGGSTSTIRNHRFTMREKMKQAKVFLTLMELVEQKDHKRAKFINVPRTAKMLDERYAITEQEEEQILQAYFKNGPDGELSEFPKKEKRKIAILKHILKRFSTNRTYTEREVNEILKEVFADYVTLRRYLVDYGFMDRYPDGSSYWVKL